jgi:hypothetical protein
MTQLGLVWNPKATPSGAERRERGLDRVETKETWVSRARAEAARIAREKGEVHIDDIRAWAERTGDKPDSSRAWGAVFRRSPQFPWEAIGVRASSHPTNHAHRSPVWALGSAT